MTLADPPSGWKYGFPKVFDFNSDEETIEEWFLRNSYPQELIDEGMLKYCWFTTKEV